MSIFSFAKDIGDKIFNRNKKDAAPAANTAAPAEPTAQEIANLLLARVQAQNAVQMVQAQRLLPRQTP